MLLTLADSRGKQIHLSGLMETRWKKRFKKLKINFANWKKKEHIVTLALKAFHMLLSSHGTKNIELILLSS